MSKGRSITIINLGGEGEEPDILNQQRPAVLVPDWRSSRDGLTLADLANKHNFLICENDLLPIADQSIDLVYTNSVPIDRNSIGGPGILPQDVHRILASGGCWIHDGTVRYTKP